MSDIIVSVADFSPVDHVAYGPPKVTQSKGKSIDVYNPQLPVSGGKPQPLRMLTPSMKTWGVSEEYPESLQLRFKKPEYASQEENTFLENLKALEENLLRYAITNSLNLLGKKNMNVDVLREIMTPLVKFRMKDGERDLENPPSFTVKLKSWTNPDTGVTKQQFVIRDANDRKIFPSTDPEMTIFRAIPSNSNVRAIIECGGIWVINGKFGMTWKVVQLMVEAETSVYSAGLFNAQRSASAPAAIKSGGPSVAAASTKKAAGVSSAAGGRTETYDSDEESRDIRSAVKQEIAATAPIAAAAATASGDKKRIIKRKDSSEATVAVPVEAFVEDAHYEAASESAVGGGGGCDEESEVVEEA